MQTVVETPTFTRQAEDLFNEDEKRELIDFLAANPMAGTRIPGTGGVRKIRYSA
ncbi:MAG: addiction module toxin RelE, partial [Gammaproteobacteria bacterium]|nr:addiction module toxin RelE [Gammaproteobacteria bacterium]